MSTPVLRELRFVYDQIISELRPHVHSLTHSNNPNLVLAGSNLASESVILMNKAINLRFGYSEQARQNTLIEMGELTNWLKCWLHAQTLREGDGDVALKQTLDSLICEYMADAYTVMQRIDLSWSARLRRMFGLHTKLLP